MKKYSLLFLGLILGTIVVGQNKISTTEILLGDKKTEFSNRAKVAFDRNNQPVIIYAFEKEGTYIQPMTTNWSKKGSAFFIKDLFFMDFEIIDNNYYVLACGKGNYTDAPSNIANYNNIEYLLKFSSDGRELFRKEIFGHQGHRPGTFFLCSMSNNAKLKYDGTYFHVFSQTCGNFATEGNPHDTHETDYYFLLDKEGNIRPGGAIPWKTGHSNALQLEVGGTGEAFTLAVGDASPYGINFFHYKYGEEIGHNILYPEQDKLLYKGRDMYDKITYTTDAGQIGGIVKLGDYLYTVIATVSSEKHPPKEKYKDLLFVKFDQHGNVIKKRWITQTANLNEAKPHIMKFGNNIFMAHLLKTGEFEYDYLVHYSVLNKEGSYIVAPKKLNSYLDWQSELFQFPNGDVGIAAVKPLGNKLSILRYGTGNLPKAVVGSTNTYPPRSSSNTNSKASYAPTEKAVRFDLTKPLSEFAGGKCKSKNISQSSKGVYINGIYMSAENGSGISIYPKEMDFNNFSIEADFFVTEYQSAPVFSLSRSYRVLNYLLRPNGTLSLDVNNGDMLEHTFIPYTLNEWHKAKITYLNGEVKMYYDGKLLTTKRATFDKNALYNGGDIHTTDFGSGRTFKGYLKSITVDKCSN